MTDSELDVLMHAVLDREATPDERVALESALARDPVARRRYGELERLFQGMAAVPQPYPPEGLVAAVTARMPAARSERGADQLFASNVVIGASAAEQRDSFGSRRARETNVVIRQTGGGHMGDQQRSSVGKSRLWVGIGLAVVGITVAATYFDFPPGGDKTAGTVLPAQRFRAPQPGAEDVKLGPQTGGTSTPTGQAGDVAQSGVGQSGIAQSGAGQAGTAQAGAGQAGIAQAGGNQAGVVQSGAGLAGSVQAGAGQSGIAQSGAGQSGIAQSGAGQKGIAQAGAGQSGIAQAGAGQSGIAQSGAGQKGVGQSGAGQSGVAQAGAGQSGAGQSGIAQGARIGP